MKKTLAILISALVGSGLLGQETDWRKLPPDLVVPAVVVWALRRGGRRALGIVIAVLLAGSVAAAPTG